MPRMALSEAESETTAELSSQARAEHESVSGMCFTVEFSWRRRKSPKGGRKILAAIRNGVTPVPIPNTTVKPTPADGTALETMRESRWLPVLRIRSRKGL